jgi:hypothetical protein
MVDSEPDLDSFAAALSQPLEHIRGDKPPGVDSPVQTNGRNKNPGRLLFQIILHASQKNRGFRRCTQ